MRFVTTDIVTGETLHADLPFTPSTITPALGSPDSIQGTLDLTDLYVRNTVRERRTMLWALANETPVAAGVVWTVDSKDATNSYASLKVDGVETLLARRIIDSDLTFTSEDAAEVVRGLLDAGTTAKTSGDIAALLYDTGDSWTNYLSSSHTTGVTVTREYLGKNRKTVAALLTELTDTTGLELRFQPTWVNEELRLVVMLAPELTASLGYSLTFPGNVSNYQAPTLGASCANKVIVVGATDATGTQAVSDASSGHGVWQEDLDDGAPLLEATVSMTSEADATQADLDARADVELISLKTAAAMTMDLPITDDPVSIESLVPGATCSISLSSYMHPTDNEEPGLSGTYRISQVKISGTASATIALDPYDE